MNLKRQLICLGMVLLAGATNTLAKPHDLNLVLINGQYAISDEEVNQVIQSSAAKLSEAGVGFKRIRKTRVADQCAQLNNLAKRLSYYACQKRALQKKRFNNYRGYTHFIAPPMVEGSFGYVAGVSDARCVARTSRSYSLSNAIAIRLPSGLPGLPLSGLVMTHEIGHSTGAGHDPASSLTVMNPNAGFLFNQHGDLPWSESTKNQIRKCLK